MFPHTLHGSGGDRVVFPIGVMLLLVAGLPGCLCWRGFSTGVAFPFPFPFPWAGFGGGGGGGVAISNADEGATEYSVGFEKSPKTGASVALRVGAPTGRDTGPVFSMGVSPSASVFSPVLWGVKFGVVGVDWAYLSPRTSAGGLGWGPLIFCGTSSTTSRDESDDDEGL